MKNVYFVLTDTGTIVSMIVKLFMHDEYGHLSISLDRKLDNMYSFGRKNPYNPFWGGFIHEYINRGTFKRFKNTKAKVLEYPVSDEQYSKIKNNINSFINKKESYKFNTIGLFAVYFNKRIQKDKYFYCAEFVKHIVEKSKLDIDLPDIIRPENFKTINGSKEIYKGMLRDYNLN